MFYHTPQDIRVCIDVGCKSHQVAVGLSTGEVIAEFSINHLPEGFRTFFAKLEQLEQQYQCPVRVAMEGYNGYARPLDSMVLARGWQLNNINNLKLARFNAQRVAASYFAIDEIEKNSKQRHSLLV